MKWLHKAVRSRERGAALLIVLAFAVLLTGLTLAYFSRTTSDRQVAHSSVHQSNVDQLAQSATDNILGDLRQEIINGSVSPAAGPPYVPTTAANAVPQRSGNPTTVPNLIRRSVSPDNILPPGLPSHASAVNSRTDASANGRSITSTRWNSHYLVPKKTIGTDDSVPIDDFTNATPDWVFVTGNGAAVITSPNSSVIGRYAYAVYDEGGLLDANVAGYPTGTNIYQYGRKGSLAFADLTAPSPYPIPNPDAGGIYQIDRLVGWRNYGTAQPTNNFPDSNPASQAFARNFQTSTASATWFYDFVVNNTSGFLSVRSDPSPTPYPWNYLNVTGDSSPATYPWNGRTDQTFIQRQELIAFRKEVGSTTSFSANALGYLSSFSREAAAGVPQWAGPSPTPTSVNPNFQTLLVTGAFTRNDGTTANVGDPLVNKRFLLERLNWLTYKGPSATRTIPSSQPGSRTDPNWDMWLLTSRFGLTAKFLQDSVVGGTAANILKYFGLVWDATNERWNYTNPSGGSLATSIATLGTLTGTREPDFFELLRAGILDDSLGDFDSVDSTLLPLDHQQSKMLHILTIGANLIAQSRTDCYPVRIACTVNVNVNGIPTPTTMEAVGVPRLPYLNSLAICPVAGTATSGLSTGGINWLLVPNLWDPFRDSWDLTEQNASSTLTPNYLRPPVRVTVSGSVGLGTVLAGSSIKTGIVPDASVTPFPSPSPALAISPAKSIALTTPTATPIRGRESFLEASRISTSDSTPTPSPFTTTTSVSPTPIAEWDNIPYPSPTPNPTPNGANVVFRISFPGNCIPASATTTLTNPVLILKPGFQMTVDYQSPNGTWYSYSFLQGNNATNTWISGSNTAKPSLNVTTTWSIYGRNPSPSPTPATTPYPTILLASPTPTAAPVTLWNVSSLAQAPMFAKAD